MSDSFEKLKEIGANNIHKETHMSIYSIEAILNKSFEKLEKVQFNGFIYILEKAYKVDLSELREEFEEYLANQPKKNKIIELHTPNPTKFNLVGIIKIVVVAVIIAILVFVYQNRTQKSPELSMQVVEINEDNKSGNSNEFTIQEAKTEDISSDTNSTASIGVEDNSTQKEILVVEKSKPKITEKKAIKVHSLTIIPKNKVWIGVINKKSGKRKQTVTSKKYVVDVNDDTLIALGHGNVEIVFGDKKVKPSSLQESRFSILNGEIKQIDTTEFRKLNKGKLW